MERKDCQCADGLFNALYGLPLHRRTSPHNIQVGHRRTPQENTYDDDTFYLLARTLALLRSNASGYKFVGPFSLVHNREVAEGHPDRTPEIHVRYLRAGCCRAHDYLPLR